MFDQVVDSEMATESKAGAAKPDIEDLLRIEEQFQREHQARRRNSSHYS